MWETGEGSHIQPGLCAQMGVGVYRLGGNLRVCAGFRVEKAEALQPPGRPHSAAREMDV